MTSGGPGRPSSRLPRGGRYHAIQALPGIGPVLAAVIVAEIGDITRFATLARLCSWAALTPGTEPELNRLAELGEGRLPLTASSADASLSCPRRVMARRGTGVRWVVRPR